MIQWDKWNWALVTSGGVLLCQVIVITVYRVHLQSTTGHVGKYACGAMGLITMWVAAGILLAATGLVWVRTRNGTPFLGMAIGMAFWLPLMLATLFVAIAARTVMPAEAAVVLLPVVVLICGLIRRPRMRRSNQPSERTR